MTSDAISSIVMTSHLVDLQLRISSAKSKPWTLQYLSWTTLEINRYVPVVTAWYRAVDGDQKNRYEEEGRDNRNGAVVKHMGTHHTRYAHYEEKCRNLCQVYRGNECDDPGDSGLYSVSYSTSKCGYCKRQSYSIDATQIVVTDQVGRFTQTIRKAGITRSKVA